MGALLVASVVAFAVAAILGALLARSRRELRRAEERYAPILDVDRAVDERRRERTALENEMAASRQANAEAEAAARQKLVAERSAFENEMAASRQASAEAEAAARQKLVAERSAFDAEIGSRRRTLQDEYAAHVQRMASERAAVEANLLGRRLKFEEQFRRANAELERLMKDVAAYEEQADLQSVGFYRPHYDYATSDEYKFAIERVRADQSFMLKARTAATCDTTWTVGGSAAEGRRMVDKVIRLILYAFNGECDAAVARVTFANIRTMETRVQKAFEKLNKLGEINGCSLSEEYLQLKLAELRLAHEHAEKVQSEKEEQRRIREQMREDERAEREMQKALDDAEREEERYQDALEKARAELADANERQKAKLTDKIAELERRLADASEKQRAISRAQQTRSGHVYVISNEGSFGPNVFKVGMTRRLDPMDRVRELGDASVPFSFDVHAMIFATDAPALESALHRVLRERAVNLVNDRKEFFAVTLDELEDHARRSGVTVEFARTVTAEEYRKTVAMRAEREAAMAKAAQPLVIPRSVPQWADVGRSWSKHDETTRESLQDA